MGEYGVLAEYLQQRAGNKQNTKVYAKASYNSHSEKRLKIFFYL